MIVRSQNNQNEESRSYNIKVRNRCLQKNLNNYKDKRWDMQERERGRKREFEEKQGKIAVRYKVKLGIHRKSHNFIIDLINQ